MRLKKTMGRCLICLTHRRTDRADRMAVYIKSVDMHKNKFSRKGLPVALLGIMIPDAANGYCVPSVYNKKEIWANPLLITTVHI